MPITNHVRQRPPEAEVEERAPPERLVGRRRRGHRDRDAEQRPHPGTLDVPGDQATARTTSHDRDADEDDRQRDEAGDREEATTR